MNGWPALRTVCHVEVTLQDPV